MVLKKIIPWTTNIQTIRLPDEQDGKNDLYNDKCPKNGTKQFVVSGWGTDYFLGIKPTVLQQVLQECLNSSKCTNVRPGEDKSTIICAGDLRITDNSACKGDSGGTKHSNIFKAKHIRYFPNF